MKVYKLALTLFTIFLISTQVQAQRVTQDKLSFGLSYGASQILGNKIPIGKSDFSPQLIQVDARYLFTPVFGLSGHYAYSGFSQKAGTDVFGFHRAVLEGLISLGEVFKFDSDVNLFAHAGAGPSLSSREKDKMITIVAGITPEFRINKQWAIKGDVSYLSNQKQYNDYTGTVIEKGKRNSGSLMNYSIGLQFYIGKGERRSIRY